MKGDKGLVQYDVLGVVVVVLIVLVFLKVFNIV